MNELPSILIVEDDIDTRRLILRVLEKSMYSVSSVGTGAEVLGMVEKGLYDLVIVDLVLPDIDGLELTRKIKAGSSAAVIILSGLGETIDRIIGLEAGADDYIAKPFDPRELLARIRSVLRRPSRHQAPVQSTNSAFVFDRWQLDIPKRELRELGGDTVDLTSGEFALLHILVERPGRVLSRDQLMDGLHGVDTPAFERSIDVRIGRLRRKLEKDPKHPQVIKTIRNGGYMLASKVSSNKE